MWEKATRTTAHDEPHDTCPSLDKACGLFMAWADTYYRRTDGTPTGEAANCELALRSLRAKCGTKSIDDIVYADILSTRESLIQDGMYRTTINQRVGVWKRFFAWALENRLCQAATTAEARAIGALKPHRSPAPEGDPVRPVPHLAVKRTIPRLPPNLQAMVLVHELCGARPSEMCSMRPCDIEQRRDVWVYRPAQHKTQSHGKVRVICLGPRAQSILAGPLAATHARDYVFTPRKAMAERCDSTGRRENSHLAPGSVWTTAGYAQAIRYATRDARKKGLSVDDWSPNQLRHACGTRVRRRFGAFAAAAVLGHSRSETRVTDIYTVTTLEREAIAAASRPMLAIG
jgi:integrase